MPLDPTYGYLQAVWIYHNVDAKGKMYATSQDIGVSMCQPQQAGNLSLYNANLTANYSRQSFPSSSPFAKVA
jgi:hypothetical protein